MRSFKCLPLITAVSAIILLTVLLSCTREKPSGPLFRLKRGNGLHYVEFVNDRNYCFRMYMFNSSNVTKQFLKYIQHERDEYVRYLEDQVSSSNLPETIINTFREEYQMYTCERAKFVGYVTNWGDAAFLNTLTTNTLCLISVIGVDSEVYDVMVKVTTPANQTFSSVYEEFSKVGSAMLKFAWEHRMPIEKSSLLDIHGNFLHEGLIMEIDFPAQ